MSGSTPYVILLHIGHQFTIELCGTPLRLSQSVEGMRTERLTIRQ